MMSRSSATACQASRGRLPIEASMASAVSSLLWLSTTERAISRTRVSVEIRVPSRSKITSFTGLAHAILL